MLNNRNGEPFFVSKGLFILAGLIAIIGIKTYIGNQALNAQRKLGAIPISSDPLCIRQPDNEAIIQCNAYWKMKGGCDPLGILPYDCSKESALNHRALPQ